MSDPVNFSVLSRSELVTRLERAQAVICMAADATAEKVSFKDENETTDNPLLYAANRGYLTGLCHALDVIQDRKTDSNYSDRTKKMAPKPEIPCEEPTFV